MENGATALALHALRLLTARSFDEGASMYRRALTMADADDVPVRRHLQLLEGSGLADAAAIVERVALRQGADISSRPIANGRDPLEGAAEYEALFARGAANARMMTAYLASR